MDTKSVPIFYWSRECFEEGRSPSPIFDLSLETSKNLNSPFVYRITPEIGVKLFFHSDHQTLLEALPK